jgi:hypothetical protein
MKRLAAMAAVFLMSAARSQIPTPEPAAASAAQPQVDAAAAESTPLPQIKAPDAAEVAAANR